MLVHQEGDLQAAEAYCCRVAQGQDSQVRRVLLLTLLQVYLASRDLTGAAVDLLNGHSQDFAAEEVIQLLPESWSVQLVSKFLVRSLRASFHQKQMARLQRALAQAELSTHKVIWVSLITYFAFYFFIFTAKSIACIPDYFFYLSVCSLLSRCRPQKRRSEWTRCRSVGFVRETSQSLSLPVTCAVS